MRIDIEQFASRLLGPVPGRERDRHVIVFFLGNAGPHGHRPELQRIAESILERVSGFMIWTPNSGNFARRGCAVDFGSGLFAATPELDEVMKHATTIVAIENSLSGFATRDGAALANKQLIHVGETVPPRPADARGDHVEGDALEVLRMLECELGRRLALVERPPVFRIHPRAVLRALNQELPKQSMLFMDICAAGMAYAGQEIRLRPGQFYELDVEQNGCMGQAFGEAIGARYGAPKQVGIACVIGDGTFCMVPSGSLHRLSISGRGGGFALTVLENGGFDFVRQGVEKGGIAVEGLEKQSGIAGLDEAKRRVERGTVGVYADSDKPDFVAAGALWRCEAYRCTSLAEYRRGLKNAFSAQRPVILEVPINTAFRAPIGDRSASIAKLFGEDSRVAQRQEVERS
jgi:thiamine pyrophosphate-dependent acetolactate synthase large subunit-like protein